eukprot:CAMPEP_0171095220 /NCGR_PEP_ID=MMETSP0766_2-20121228/43052_1 /TAXON_ID=439317 /ORGANISM="Gambierdiscus australes, Strain CAWD 149" /LENGTH=78 /DNA_ID=CAMNT_0011554003 /DNA_START=47 /DNA_END=283 /DNA_ORIENTATION=+
MVVALAIEDETGEHKGPERHATPSPYLCRERAAGASEAGPGHRIGGQVVSWNRRLVQRGKPDCCLRPEDRCVGLPSWA